MNFVDITKYKEALDKLQEEKNIPLTEGMERYELDLSHTEITHLPEDIKIEFRIDLTGCRQLKKLPDGLKTGTLWLSGCTGLTQLPENLDVCFLSIRDCTQLSDWPQTGRIRFGNLIARNCTKLETLPTWLTRISQLDISGCTAITSLPENLQVSSWIDIAYTGITELPDSIDESQLRWRGVPINKRIAFRPEEITSEEILNEPNSELRRVMLERVGFDRFFEYVDAEVLDTDTDPGGKRELLKVPLEDDEDLVCVSVRCPSTDRRYIIRVPPDTKTCIQAIAWTAGFDDPDDYHPLAET